MATTTATPDYLGLWLDPDTGDVGLDAGGNLRMAMQNEAIGQHAQQRLRLYRGEWFLDTTAGTPWMQYVFNEDVYTPAIAQAVISDAIVGTPGVTSIDDFEMTIDRPSRGLKVMIATVNTVLGATTEITL